jgi:N-acyl amino acid synthase of PEP-CTERM/exosortase system
MESDEYDAGSNHFVVYGTNIHPVGYMRTVPADSNGQFPVFSHGLRAHEGTILPDPDTAVECSRLMVRPDIRFQPVHVSFPQDPILPNPPAANASVLIQTKLVRMAYRDALERGVRYFHAALEPPLARRLNTLGFPLRAIGPPGEYFGAVTPYLMDLREMERNMRAAAPLTWAFFDNPADDPHSSTHLPGEWPMPPGSDIIGGYGDDDIRLPDSRNTQYGLRLN